MRKLTALVAGMTLAMSALPAAAGVVITQKVHSSSGAHTKDSEQTISVQGNKEKVVRERNTIITDLDKGMIYVLEPNSKTYFEMEFPPKGPMAAMMAASQDAAMNFKKAGSTREIAGSKCIDYDGSGHVMAGEYTVKECFSTTAPGAEEFAAFEKNMADKLKSAGTSSGNGKVPGGVPLAVDATTKMSTASLPSGLPPEQAAKIREVIEKRPPVVVNQMVEKIESKKLADSDFAVPSDYTKKEMPGPGAMMMKPSGAMKMPPPAGAPSPATH